MEKYCRKFLQLLEEGDFYGAHEALEEFWFPRRRERSPEILLIKGFINASVALELKRRKYPEERVLQVWRTYSKYRPLLAECREPILERVERVLDRWYREYLISSEGRGEEFERKDR
ncbi:MAG: DUF309 domain-containing protein [Epsilonproteobacteria bacterium]|nr:DUF309 domain-containing protein [Campylobacterota bacterium]NPA56321.1 DUF309 domain-containing protein [Campylobacterota bacterium]